MDNGSIPYEIKGEILTGDTENTAVVLNPLFVLSVVLLPDRTAHNCNQKAHTAGHSNESVQSLFCCVTGADGYKPFLL